MNKNYIEQPLDQRMIEGILNPEQYMFLSFYPSPICCELAEDLTSLGITDREEIMKRCKHRMYKNGIQEWILDGEEVLFRANPTDAIGEDGKKIDEVLALQFERPFREKSKNK